MLFFNSWCTLTQYRKYRKTMERNCRICFESGVTDQNTLIAPCLCAGDSRWIHYDCLDRWRHTQTGQSLNRCEICHYIYELMPIVETDHERRMRVCKYFGVITTIVLYGFCWCVMLLALSAFFIGVWNWHQLRQQFPDTPPVLLYSMCSVLFWTLMTAVHGLKLCYRQFTDIMDGACSCVRLIQGVLLLALCLPIGLIYACYHYCTCFNHQCAIIWKAMEVRRSKIRDLSQDLPIQPV